MVLYECKSCNFKTKLKTDYSRHLKTKKHGINTARECDGIEENDTKTQKDPKKTQKDPKRPKKDPKRPGKNFKCDFCDSEFSTFAHKRRHENHRCKIRFSKENELIKHLKEEKKQLYKQIDKLIEKAGNNTTINNSAINNQSNTINLNSYGNEDMSHITDAFKSDLLKIPFGMIPKMIEAVHFNPGKPENKNIALPNKKEKTIKIFSGNQWVFKDRNDVINELLDGKYFILDTHYEKVGETLNPFQADNYQKFKSEFDDCDKELLERLKKECELILLNNR